MTTLRGYFLESVVLFPLSRFPPGYKANHIYRRHSIAAFVLPFSVGSLKPQQTELQASAVFRGLYCAQARPCQRCFLSVLFSVQSDVFAVACAGRLYGYTAL